MACTGYPRAMEKHYRPHRLKHVLNYKAEHTTLSLCLSLCLCLCLSLDVTWRSTCRADIEIAGKCLISYTLQNAGCWTSSSCGDSSECPARRQQGFQSEGRRRAGQHRYRLATQTNAHSSLETWRIRTTPKASASEGRPLAIFEGTRKDPGYEMNSQQKQTSQVAIILTFPP